MSSVLGFIGMYETPDKADKIYFMFNTLTRIIQTVNNEFKVIFSNPLIR